MTSLRPALDADLPALTEIYNHYVLTTHVTFDLQPFGVEERRPWFAQHATTGRHRLVVAQEDGRVLGYASTSRFRPKPGYDTTVEASVYCHPGHVGRGLGTRLYRALFQAIADEDVHRIVAGVALPNAASMALHGRVGFRTVGVFSNIGRKFDRYWDVAWLERPLEVAKEDRASGS